jgi:hypothetical protein
MRFSYRHISYVQKKPVLCLGVCRQRRGFDRFVDTGKRSRYSLRFGRYLLRGFFGKRPLWLPELAENKKATEIRRFSVFLNRFTQKAPHTEQVRKKRTIEKKSLLW